MNEVYAKLRREMPQETNDFRKIARAKEKVLEMYPELMNLNGVEIRNPITLQIHGDSDQEEIPKFQIYSKIPMPESYKLYIEKHNNQRDF